MTHHQDKRLMPRDGAGRMQLEGGSGPLVHMISVPKLGFMENYKVDKTYQVQAPDNIDPKRTKADVPWAWRISDDAGCSNPIIARVLIQCVEALNNKTLNRGDPETIKVALHSCKQQLRNCETTFLRIAEAYKKIVESLNSTGGIRVEKSVVNDLPHIPQLEHEATIFITSAKRALQHIAEVLNEFYGITISNAHFHKGKNQLRALKPEPRGQLECLEAFNTLIERVLNLRNFQEHAPKKTFVQNFHLTANAFEPPHWGVEPELGVPILPEMRDMLGSLIELAEASFFHGLMDNLDHPPGPFAYVVEQVTKDSSEHECAVRYRCELKFGTQVDDKKGN